jgi:hypothetical protein
MEKHLRATSQLDETMAESPIGAIVEIVETAELSHGSYGSIGEANDSLG